MAITAEIQDRDTLLAKGMLLTVAAVWGASYGMAKTAIELYPVLGFLAIRFLITATLLSPALLRQSMEGMWSAIKLNSMLGLILFSIFVAETYGLSLTKATNAAFLISACVVFTPLVEWGVLGSKPSLSAVASVLCSFLGVWFLVSGTQLNFSIGDALILVAALLRAFMVTFTNKIASAQKVSALAMTCIQSVVVGGGALTLEFLLVPQEMSLPPFTLQFWGPTIFLIIFCTVFAFFVQNFALRTVSPTRVSLLMGSEPAFGAAFAVVWLREALTPIEWFGGALIVGTSLWAATRKK